MTDDQRVASATTAAGRLRALHVAGAPLVLPNAWDADTAAAVVEAGFPVVATSSVAVARSLGHADEEQAPVDEMLAAAERITRAVNVPVSVDVESGYGLPPVELVERLLELGASGCNIEDTDNQTGTRRAPEEQAALLAEFRAAGREALVLNARIDSFLGGRVDEWSVLPDAVDRAHRYLAAGADVVYPIDARDPAVIAEFTRQVQPHPVNVTLLPGGPDLAELGASGVARVSLGGGLRTVAREAVARFLADLAGHSRS